MFLLKTLRRQEHEGFTSYERGDVASSRYNGHCCGDTEVAVRLSGLMPAETETDSAGKQLAKG